MFPSNLNVEILGKQNSVFPSGPVIKCLLLANKLWKSQQSGINDHQIALACVTTFRSQDYSSVKVKKRVKLKENLPRFSTMPLLTNCMAASESALFLAERVVKAFVKTLSMVFCNGKQGKKN